MNQIPLTGLTFFNYFTTRDSSFIPIIMANSIIGIYYTYTERKKIKYEGGYTFGINIKVNYWQNTLVNFLGHILLTIYILKTHKPFDYSYNTWLISFYVLSYLILFDFEAVYVSDINEFDHYFKVYLLCLFIILTYYRYKFVNM